MESNELLQSLAKLETSLSDVESAKKQVQQTVDAYSALQKQIAEYTKSLDSIKTGVQGIISDLNARKASLGDEAISITASLESKCNQLLETLTSKLAAANEIFSKEGKAISDSFKENTDAELTNLQQNVKALSECTGSLSDLHKNIKDTLAQMNLIREDVANLKKAIESSQSAQDIILDEIKAGIVTLSKKQEDAFSSQNSSISSVEKQCSEQQLTLGILQKRQSTGIIISSLCLVAIIVLVILFILK